MQRRLATLVTTGLLASGVALTAQPAQAANGGALLYGLTSANHLVSFRELSPGTTVSDVAVTGLGTDTLVGLDVRPKTGLIALGSSGRVYAIALDGTATATTGTAPTLSGTSFGVDVNPTVDRVRVVSDTGQNLRLNPDTGALAATDTPLAYAAGDPKAGSTPVVTAAAYTNSVDGSTATTLYDIDVAADALVTQAPPNNGTLNTVGSLGVDATGSAGFDIDAATGRAFAVLTVGGSNGLYTVDLTSGAATLVGAALTGLVDVTAAPVARPAYLLLTDNSLVALDLSRPGTASAPVAVSIPGGADIVGIDVRPATGVLYALTADSKLYTIAPATGAATFASTLSVTLSGAAFGVDFNPVADRLRVTSDTGQNLRVNVETGAATTDAALNGATTSVVGSGYTNSFTDASSTTLYDISAATDTLYVQNPPNNGTTVAVGTGLGVDVNPGSDLDIAPDGNAAYAVLTTTAPGLYRLNLTTGRAALVAPVNALAEDLAIASPGSLAAGHAAGVESQPTATVTVQRYSGTAGVLAVDYATGGGTATAGVDYTPTSGTLRFADGETSKSFTVALLQDTLTEGPETIGITFSNELGGTTPVDPTTVTIIDDERATGYALTSDNKLGTFALDLPGYFKTLVPITGTGSADVVGIDVRPATGALYALTADSKLYTVDPTTGAATLASTLSTALSGSTFGVDFNPVPDRLRITSDTGQNLRVNVDTGAVTTDAALNGATTSAIGSAYTNSFAGATTTTLYDVSASSDSLYVQNPPNNGTTTLVGPLGIDILPSGDLDILGNGNTAFGAFFFGGSASLCRVDLASGATTVIGDFQATDVEDLAFASPGRLSAAPVTVAESGGSAVVTVTRTAGSSGTLSVDYATTDGLATAGADYTATSGTLTFGDGDTSETITVPVADDAFPEGTEAFGIAFSNPQGGTGPVAATTVTVTDNDKGTAYGLTAADHVVTFDPTAPTTAPTADKAVTGLGSGEDVLALDVRPANGKLYALTSTGRLLVVDPATGATQAVSTLSTVPTGVVSVDVNPVVDRLRVVTSTGENLRVNIDTGAVTTDTAVAYATGDAGAGSTPAIGAIAYTNSAAGQTATTLLGLETGRDVLVTQDPPNAGTISTIGPLGVDLSTAVGLDIGFPGNSAFVVAAGAVHRVDLATGAITTLGALATPVEDLALASAPVPQAGRYHALAPSRVLDTRTTATALVGGTDRTLVVAGQGGVPATGVSAVVLNVTLTDGSAKQNLAVFPAGQKPDVRTSNLNADRKQTVAVQVQTGLGTAGAIGLSLSTGSADVVVDVLGWYGDSSDRSGAGYQALTPSRLLDTRTTSTPLTKGTVRNQQVSGLSGVPAGATAVAVNVTATGATRPTYLQLSPGGSAPATQSTLNVVPGQTVANAAVVGLGSDGSVDLRVGDGSVSAIVDVVGYYGPTAGGRFVPVTPSRLLDTRSSGGPVGGGADRDLVVTGVGGVPATGASAVVLTVTGTQALYAGYVAVFPKGSPTTTSTLNLVPGRDVANLAVSAVGTGGAVTLRVAPRASQVVVDVTGYFTQP